MRHLLVHLTILSSLLVAFSPVHAQSRDSARDKGASQSQSKQKLILPVVKAWHMTDDCANADSIGIDTVPAEHELHNPIWRKTVSSVSLGNLGSPAISTFYPDAERDEGNVFYNALKLDMLDPDDVTFYNTRTPYARLTYQKGIPKRVAEEFFSALFTQNVNRKANVGFLLDINSAIGRYERQSADNRKFGFWTSVDGDYYHLKASAFYQRFEIEENDGLTDERVVLYPDSFDYDDPQDYPVRLMDMKNRLASYRLSIGNQWDFGFVTRQESDTSEIDIPAASAFYHFYIDRSHHDFTIDDIASCASDSLLFMAYVNDEKTSDNRKYMLLHNIVQVRMNEEFNSLLRFGLRAYLGNDLFQYRWDLPTDYVEEVDDESGVAQTVAYSHRAKRNNTSTYLGGEIFKHSVGDSLSRISVTWNAGARLVFAGYNVGDVRANGALRFAIGSGKWRTNIWGRAQIELRSPTHWEEHFCSNHFAWSHDFDREKTVDIRAGLDVPGVRLNLAGFSSTMTDRVYFGQDGMPRQSSKVVQVLGVSAREHFVSPIGFNCIIRAAVQKTTNNDVVPAPTFSLIATSFWEHKFFGVLLTQIGFDVRYSSRYYAPSYIPAIMQFVAQNDRKVGGYGFFDPYVNFHLKKIRAYAKYEHVNSHWGSQDYFLLPGYAANPATFKFGLSWNFYN